jgi:ADP-L-glycero-D-manno-heptose 6-epimerase
MYLVTGGAGFIGSHLVASLAERGEAVVVCDRLHDDERWHNLAKHEIADLITPEALPGWLSSRAQRVKAILHMGAISTTTETNVDLIVENNVRLTLDLLRWCTESQVRFIYASSAATYGNGAEGFDDEFSSKALARLRPLNAYGWSKHVIDRRVARLVAERAALPPQWVGLKFFNVYGPNEYHKGTMQSVVVQNYARVAAGESLRLFRSHHPEYPDGGQRRDFVYVRDCVNVIEWLLNTPHVSGLFNLGTGSSRTWLDLARAVFAAAGRKELIEFIDMPAPLIAKYQYFTEARMTRLRAAGYEQPFTSLEDGVADYVQRYLATSDRYR